MLFASKRNHYRFATSSFQYELGISRKHVINIARLRNCQHVASQSGRERNTHEQMLIVLHQARDGEAG